MAGLDPSIHAAPLGVNGGARLLIAGLDGRVKPGHDAAFERLLTS
jgi:hypothetical protein